MTAEEHAPVPPPSTGRRRRLRIVLASVVAGVVLLGGGALAAVLVLKGPSGEDAVRAYFDRLAAGDAAGALAHVLAAAEGGYDDEPLLTAAMLADAATRPTDLVVGHTEQFARRAGGIGERITVSYTVGETRYQQEVVAVQAASDEPFLLERPFFDLRLPAEEGWAYAINGVPVDATAVLAFPGVYEATRAGNVLFAEVRAPAEADDTSELPTRLQFTFSDRLAAGAHAAVQEAVNGYLDACARDHALAPTATIQGTVVNCPFALRANENLAVTWSVARYPEVSINLDEVVWFSSTAKGLVRYDLPAGWQDDEFEFEVTGWAATGDGSTISIFTNYRG